MRENEGLEVKCFACRQVYLETTEHYDPSIKPNGTMVRLKEKYRNYGWSPFGDGLSHSQACKKSRAWYAMTCPGCNGNLCPKGELIVIPRPSTYSPVEIHSDEDLEREWNERVNKKEFPVNIILTGNDNLVKSYDKMLKEERNQHIFRMKDEGMPNNAIAKEVGISAVMVGKIINRQVYR